MDTYMDETEDDVIEEDMAHHLHPLTDRQLKPEFTGRDTAGLKLRVELQPSSEESYNRATAQFLPSYTRVEPRAQLPEALES